MRPGILRRAAVYYRRLLRGSRPTRARIPAILAAIVLLGGACTERAPDQTSQVEEAGHTVFDAHSSRYTFSAPVMGTEFRIVLHASDSLAASLAAAAAFSLADSLEMIMSDYRPDSELSRLSASAGSDSFMFVSESLARILLEAREISDATDGAFDVTSGALTRLWRRSTRRGTLPPDTAIARARSSVNHTGVEFDSSRRRVRLRQPGARLDLGGIAKGFAADRMLERLNTYGFGNALVDAGGDIAVGDAPPGERGWSVSIGNAGEEVDAAGRVAPSRVLVVSNSGIATSGDTYRSVESSGRRYSHIIDPTTGYGTTHTQAVTVLAPSATLADAFASALSVMSVDEALQAAESHPTLEARILSRTDSTTLTVLRQTSGFPLP